MKGYYINLEKDKEKRERMEILISKLPLEISRYSAKTAQDIPATYKEKIFSKDYLQFASDGALGCAYTHISLWRKIASGNTEHVLILEDDIIFDKEFSERISTLEFPPEYDIIYLGCRGICGEGCVNITGENTCSSYNELYDIPRWSVSTYAYLVSKKGAVKLLDRIPLITEDFDIKIGRLINENTLLGYSLKNSLITHTNRAQSNILLKKKILLGHFFPILNQPILKLGNTYPLDFYIDVYSVLVVCLAIVVSYKYRKHSRELLVLLLFANWGDFIFGFHNILDRRALFQATFDTIIPIFLYLIISRNTKCNI